MSCGGRPLLFGKCGNIIQASVILEIRVSQNLTRLKGDGSMSGM